MRHTGNDGRRGQAGRKHTWAVVGVRLVGVGLAVVFLHPMPCGLATFEVQKLGSAARRMCGGEALRSTGGYFSSFCAPVMWVASFSGTVSLPDGGVDLGALPGVEPELPGPLRVSGGLLTSGDITWSSPFGVP